MLLLINSILFFIGFIWMIFDRAKFEKKHKGDSGEFASLYREHNTLQIVLLAVLTFYCLSKYFGID
jgi:hypothetical protein